MNEALWQRYRVPLACGVIGALLATLVVREGIGQWRQLAQWRDLAELAATLQEGPSLGLERLQQSAQARQVRLLDVDTQGDAWQLRGQVEDEQVLQDWLLALQAEGGRPLQWGVEQDESGLRFDLLVQP
ncbi:type II secretion system protein GspM [Pseudomonas sp. X10]